DCAYRTWAGIIGDTAAALGLRAPGNVEENAAHLRRFCAGRRCLLIFDRLDPEYREALAFVGKTSVLFTAVSEPPPMATESAAASFAAWTRKERACLRSLGYAQRHLLDLVSSGPDEWPRAVQLGSAMVALLKHAERLAEAHEILELLVHAAQICGDFGTR